MAVFRIPGYVYYDRAMNWCASWLPEPKPVGLKVFGYDVTWLDIAMVIGGLLIALSAWFYYGNWLWFVKALCMFIGMWVLFFWPTANKGNRDDLK
jgi:hypothetical protein